MHFIFILGPVLLWKDFFCLYHDFLSTHDIDYNISITVHAKKLYMHASLSLKSTDPALSLDLPCTFFGYNLN